MQAVPGLQRTFQPIAMVFAEVDTGSSFVIQTGKTPSMEFSGDVKLGITSAESSVASRPPICKLRLRTFPGWTRCQQMA